MKTCIRCGVEKELAEFRPRRGECRECALAYGREYRKPRLKGGKPGNKTKTVLDEQGNFSRPCSKCGLVLPLSNFSTRGARGGHMARCKLCNCIAVKKRYHEDPTAVRESGRVYREKNAEKRSVAAKERRLKNPEAAREKARKYYWENPEKARAYAREAARKYPDRVRSRFKNWKDKNPGYWIEHEYGITLQEREFISASQGGVCAICKQKPSKKLCVDHDHMSGKVRGLLCSLCNQALGLLRDSSTVAQQATDYLKKHGK